MALTIQMELKYNGRTHTAILGLGYLGGSLLPSSDALMLTIFFIHRKQSMCG